MGQEATGHPLLLTCVIPPHLGRGVVRGGTQPPARGYLTFTELRTGNRIFSQEDNTGSQTQTFDFYVPLCISFVFIVVFLFFFFVVFFCQ